MNKKTLIKSPLDYGNYTEEREQLFGDQTVERLVAEIKRQKARPIKEARGSLPGLNTDVLREEEDRL